MSSAQSWTPLPGKIVESREAKSEAPKAGDRQHNPPDKEKTTRNESAFKTCSDNSNGTSAGVKCELLRHRR